MATGWADDVEIGIGDERNDGGVNVNSVVDDGLPWHLKDSVASPSRAASSSSLAGTRNSNPTSNPPSFSRISKGAEGISMSSNSAGSQSGQPPALAHSYPSRRSVFPESIIDVVADEDVSWVNAEDTPTPRMVLPHRVSVVPEDTTAERDIAPISPTEQRTRTISNAGNGGKRRMSTAGQWGEGHVEEADHSELRVRGLPKYYTMKDVCELLAPFGELQSVRTADPDANIDGDLEYNISSSRQTSLKELRANVQIGTTPTSDVTAGARKRKGLVYLIRFKDERATSCAFLSLGHVVIDNHRLQVTYINTRDPFWRAVNQRHRFPTKDGRLFNTRGTSLTVSVDDGPLPSRMSHDFGVDVDGTGRHGEGGEGGGGGDGGDRGGDRGCGDDRGLMDIGAAMERARLQRCLDFVDSIRVAFRPMGMVAGFLGFVPYSRMWKRREYIVMVYCVAVYLVAMFGIGSIWYGCYRSLRDRRSSGAIGEVALGLCALVHLVLYGLGVRVTNMRDKFRQLAHRLIDAQEVARLRRGVRIKAIITTTLFLLAWLCFSLALNFESPDFLDFLPPWARFVQALGTMYIFGACAVALNLSSSLRVLMTISVRRYGERVMRRQVDMDAVIFRYSDISLMVQNTSRMFSEYIVICFAVCVPMAIFAAYAIIESGGPPHLGTLLVIFISYVNFLGAFWYDTASPTREMGAILDNFKHMNAIVQYADSQRVQDFLNYTQHDVIGYRVLGFIINQRFGAGILYVGVYLIAVVSITKIT